MERAEPQKHERKRSKKARKVPTVTTSPLEQVRFTLSPALAARFEEFAGRSEEFSRELIGRGELRATTNAEHGRLNIRIARTVFSKWSIEILTFLYTTRVARFQEIRKALGDISARVLSLKLTRLEGLGFVRRAVLDTRPPGVEYSLTVKGLHVAKLGEPVFLYLRLSEGTVDGVAP